MRRSLLIAAILALAAIAGLPRSERRESVSWGFLSAACAVAVLMNGSKGAIVALCIGMAAVAVLRELRLRLRWLLKLLKLLKLLLLHPHQLLPLPPLQHQPLHQWLSQQKNKHRERKKSVKIFLWNVFIHLLSYT